MSRIAVVGGNGQIARLLHPLLGGAGHTPVALVRREEYRAELESRGAEVRLLDIEQDDAAGFAAAFEGVTPWSSRPAVGRTATWSASAPSTSRARSSRSRGPGRPASALRPGLGHQRRRAAARRHRAGLAGLRRGQARRRRGPARQRPRLDHHPSGRLTDDEATGLVELGEDVARGEVPRADVAAVLAEVIDSGAGSAPSGTSSPATPRSPTRSPAWLTPWLRERRLPSDVRARPGRRAPVRRQRVVQALTAPTDEEHSRDFTPRRTHRRRAEPRHRRGARPGLRDPPLQRRRPRRAAPGASPTSTPSWSAPRPRSTPRRWPPRHLKVVARAGVGLDNVDVKAATQAGVMVVNAPTSNIVSRRRARRRADARRRPPRQPRPRGAEAAGSGSAVKYTGIELYEKTVGIVGLGRIGVLVAQRLSAFGMKVIAYDPYVQAGRAAQMGVRLVDLDTLLAEADFMQRAPAQDPRDGRPDRRRAARQGQAVARARQRRPRWHRRRGRALRRR